MAERKEALAKSVSFREAFAAFFAIRQKALSNAKHLQQWPATMETYVFPRIGNKAASEITHADILSILI